MNRRANTTHALYGDVCYERIRVSTISFAHGSTSDVVGSMGSFGLVHDTPFALAGATSRPPMRNLTRTSMPRDVRSRPRSSSQSAGPGDHAKNKGLEKLRREDYNPGGVQRYNSGYSSRDGKRSCAVCLDDFEPREMVIFTPCHHMFHEKCIVPWVMSHGQCPVCRFVIADQNGSRSGNNIGLEDDPFARDFLSFIRSMEGRG